MNVASPVCPTFGAKTLDMAVTMLSAEYEEPTSGLEPLTCSLRVISQVLQGFARACKSPISKRLSFLCLALCCTVLRSRWYQSGIKRSPLIKLKWYQSP